MATAKKSRRRTRAASPAPAVAPGPDKDRIADELLAVWDADTWLTLPQLRVRYAEGWTLDDVGIRSVEAEGYVNKYNSIITRTASDPVPVSPSEAAAWVKKKMSGIVDEVFKRASA